MEALETAIEDSHDINQRIFDTSIDLILVTDRHGNFVRVSPSSFEILGYHPAEMVGRLATRWLHPDDLDNTRNEMRAARRGKIIRHFECRYIHKTGAVVHLNWTGVWSAPEQQHFFIGRDVTDLKLLMPSLDEINALLKDVTDRLAAKQAERLSLWQHLAQWYRTR